MDSRRFRFGLFAFDASNGELRREGALVHLQAQPARVLSQLISRAGTAGLAWLILGANAALFVLLRERRAREHAATHQGRAGYGAPPMNGGPR